MKQSKLVYHNGAIKIEVYEKGSRKRWNTGVRVDKKLLSKERFVKPNPSVDWESMNVKISEEKERVDRLVRQVFQEHKRVDVSRIFEILEQQKSEEKTIEKLANGKASIANGSTKKKLGGAIRELQHSIQLRGKYKVEVKGKSRDENRRENFFLQLDAYLAKESSVTSHSTISRHFVTYLKEGTTIGFNNLKRHYLIFDFMVNHPLLIEDVNDVWIRKLLEWLEFGVRGQRVNSNTTDWLFGRFQCFWTWALNTNLVFKRIHWKRFKRITFKPGFVWLTEERITQLAKHKFANQRLEYSRMSYLIMTLTAMRHSDFHSFNSSNLVREGGVWFIHMSNKKTKTAFKVEVHDSILAWVQDMAILKKIRFSMDSTRSNHLLNDGIREMGEVMGWKEPVRLQVDADKWETKPFYDWMNCHSARHSAVCFWLSYGVNHTTIKKWTGWKGSKMIDYYADILNIKTKESINNLIKLNP